MNEENNTVKKHIGVNFLFSMLISIILGLVNLGYPVLVGMLYGPELLGRFSVLFYWATLLNMPISNGLAIGITRFIAIKSKNDHLKIEGIGIKITLYYLFGLIIVYPLIGYFFFSLSIIEVVIVMFVLVNLAFHYLLRKSIQGKENFQYLLKIEVISFVIFIPFLVCITILPKLLSWNFVENYYYILFSPIIAYHFAFNCWLVINKRKQINLKSIFKLPSETKQILLFTLFMSLGALFSIGISQVQVIVSENYLTELELGVLGFWTPFLGIFGLLTISTGNLLLPRMTNLSKAEDEHILRSFVNIINWAFTLIFTSLAVLIFVIIAKYPVIMDVITLRKFNMDAFWLVVLLLGVREINFAINEPAMVYIRSSDKRVRFYPIVSSLHALVVIVSWIFLTPIYGIIGFAIGIASGSVIYTIINLIFLLVISKKKIGSNIIGFITNIIIGVGAIVLLQFWSSVVIIILIAIYAAAAISYGIYLIMNVLRNNDYNKDYTITTETTEEITN